MRAEKLAGIINRIDDCFIEEAEEYGKENIIPANEIPSEPKNNKRLFYIFPVAAACAALVLTVNHFTDFRKNGEPDIDNSIVCEVTASDISDTVSTNIASVSESEINSTVSSKSTSSPVNTMPFENTSSRYSSYVTSASNALLSSDFSSETTKESSSEINETSAEKIENTFVSDSTANIETTIESREYITSPPETHKVEKPVAGGGFKSIISAEDNVKYLNYGLFSISVEYISKEVTENFILDDYNIVVYSINPDVFDEQYINVVFIVKDETEESGLCNVYINESYSYNESQIILNKLID